MDRPAGTAAVPADSPQSLSRRGFLTAGSMMAATLAACSGPEPAPAATAGPSTPPSPAPAPSGLTSPGQPAGSAQPELSPGGPAASVPHGPRDRPEVALTFHLGPHAAGEDLTLARQLLADVVRLSAPITMFAVGQWLDEHRELVPTILAAGAELANHTFTHPTLAALPADGVAAEITGCRDVLARLAPAQGRYFRPSGGGVATPLILAEAGAAGYRTVVGFDVDPLDYTSPGADAVVERVRAGARPGSIVSMHCAYPGTVRAFPRIVANLRTAGLTPVLVHDLLT